MATASLWREGLSAAEIQAEQPALQLDQIHAAVAFYLHNRAAIDAHVRNEDEETDRAASEHHRRHGFPV